MGSTGNAATIPRTSVAKDLHLLKSRCVIKGGTRSPGWENCGLQLIQKRRNLVRKLVRCQPEICTKNV